jgi:type IV pilus assembly protein PilX
MPSTSRATAPLHAPRQEAGLILIGALLALVILLISAVAMVRSFDTSLLISGNLAFKRDLVNRGERGVASAIALLKTGALSSETTREANSLANNYSASILATNDRGVPSVLINDSTYTSVGMTATDLDAGDGVTLRTVIDRQCSSGTTTFSSSTCIYVPGSSDAGGTNWLKKAGAEFAPVYRISVRVSGPRNTQVFLQATLTR